MARSLLLKLYVIMREFRFDFSDYESEFESRKLFQKMVYLTQILGLDFGYDYNLYLHGPYSPGLTEDGYKIINYLDQIEEKSRDVSLNDEGDELKNKFNTILDKTKELDMNTVDWLELLTTLHYLKENISFTNTDKDEIINKLIKLKPQFEGNTEAINLAWDIIEDLSGV